MQYQQRCTLVLGIDFGTSFSSAAIMLNGQIQTVKEPSGRDAMPSSVLLTPAGDLVVGYTAENEKGMYPERFRDNFKRDLGAEYRITLGEQSFEPVDLVSAVIGEFKKEGEHLTGDTLSAAVITVPATYTPFLREKMEQAATQPGSPRPRFWKSRSRRRCMPRTSRG